MVGVVVVTVVVAVTVVVVTEDEEGAEFGEVRELVRAEDSREDKPAGIKEKKA